MSQVSNIIQVSDHITGLSYHPQSAHSECSVVPQISSTSSGQILCIECAIQQLISNSIVHFPTWNRLLNDLETIIKSSPVRSQLWMSSDIFLVLLMAITRAMCRFSHSEDILFVKLKAIASRVISSCPDHRELQSLTAAIEELYTIFTSVSLKEFLGNASMDAILFFVELCKAKSFVFPNTLESSLVCIATSSFDWRLHPKIQTTSLEIVIAMLNCPSSDVERPAYGLAENQNFIDLFLKAQNMLVRSRILQVLLLIMPNVHTIEDTALLSHCRALELTFFSEDMELCENSLWLLYYFVQLSPSTCHSQTNSFAYLVSVLGRLHNSSLHHIIIECFRHLFPLDDFLMKSASAIFGLLSILVEWSLKDDAQMSSAAFQIALELVSATSHSFATFAICNADSQHPIFPMLCVLLMRALRLGNQNHKLLLIGLKHVINVHRPSSQCWTECMVSVFDIWQQYSSDIEIIIEILDIVNILASQDDQIPFLTDFLVVYVLPNMSIVPFGKHTGSIGSTFWLQALRVFNTIFRKTTEEGRQRLISNSTNLISSILQSLECNAFENCQQPDIILEALLLTLPARTLEHTSANSIAINLDSFRISFIINHLREKPDRNVELYFILLAHVLQVSKWEISNDLASAIVILIDGILITDGQNPYILRSMILLLCIIESFLREHEPVVKRTVHSFAGWVASCENIEMFSGEQQIWKWIWTKSTQMPFQKRSILKACLEKSSRLDIPADQFLLFESGVPVNELPELCQSIPLLQTIVSNWAVDENCKLATLQFAKSIIASSSDLFPFLPTFVKWLDKSLLDKSFFEEHISAMMTSIGNMPMSLLKASILCAVVPKNRGNNTLAESYLQTCLELAVEALQRKITTERNEESKIRSSLTSCISTLCELLQIKTHTAIDILEIGLKFANVQTYPEMFTMMHTLLKNHPSLLNEQAARYKILKVTEVAISSNPKCIDACILLAYLVEKGVALSFLKRSQSFRMLLNSAISQSKLYQTPLSLPIVYLLILMDAPLSQEMYKSRCPIRQSIYAGDFVEISNFKQHHCQECGADGIQLHLTMADYIRRIRIFGLNRSHQAVHIRNDIIKMTKGAMTSPAIRFL